MGLGTNKPNAVSRNRTILVIEDEEAIAELLRDELAVLGYTVVMAANGQDGLDKLQDIEPDLIICDRIMPLMTGTELLGRLRGAYPQYKKLPFIFLTALTSAQDRVDADGLNPFAYLEKPLDFALLQKTIEHALQ